VGKIYLMARFRYKKVWGFINFHFLYLVNRTYSIYVNVKQRYRLSSRANSLDRNLLLVDTKS